MFSSETMDRDLTQNFLRGMIRAELLTNDSRTCKFFVQTIFVTILQWDYMLDVFLTRGTIPVEMEIK